MDGSGEKTVYGNRQFVLTPILLKKNTFVPALLL